MDCDTSVATTPGKKRVKVEPGNSNIGKVEQQAAIVCSPLGADGDSDLLVNIIFEAVEGHFREAHLLKEGAKWVADRERSPLKRQLVQVWGIAGDLIGRRLCTYVPCPTPPHIVLFIY